jgi:hypothetical protein
MDLVYLALLALFIAMPLAFAAACARLGGAQ